MISKISSWVNKYKKYFFRYRNGFYEFPFIANSPQRLAKAYIDAPFIKQDKINKRFLINSLFLTANVTFYEIEEGFWMYFVKVHHKKKIKYVPYYEANEKDDYYMFSINEMHDNVKLKARSDRKEFYMENIFWTLVKPRNHVHYIINKNSNTRCINVHFDQAWLEKNILNDIAWRNKAALTFLNSPQTKVTWTDTTGIDLDKTLLFTEMLQRDKSDISPQELIEYVKKLLTVFFGAFDGPNINLNYFNLSDPDREKIFKIENYLITHLTQDFVGIDFLSKHFYLSPTKLKADFKTMFGSSIFQYFRNKQMELAEQLIKTNTHSIKEIAYMMGYESASKFAIAFKECRGFSPSKI